MRNLPQSVAFILGMLVLFAGTLSAKPPVIDQNHQLVSSTDPSDTTFGYWLNEWVDDTYTPLTGATSIQIPTGNPGGDSWYREIPLPFDFDFYGTDYPENSVLTLTDDMYISFNPYVGFSESFLNDCPLDGTEPNNMIAPFWDDGIAYSATAQLLYKVEGTAPNRQLVIEWRDFDVIGPSPDFYLISVQMSHQVVLFENGDVEFRYGPRQSPNPGNVDCEHQDMGCSATIGIEGGVGTSHDVDSVSCGMDSITNGTGVHFYHPFGNPQPVPTVSEWGMIILFILLMGSALWVIRRKQNQKPA